MKRWSWKSIRMLRTIRRYWLSVVQKWAYAPQKLRHYLTLTVSARELFFSFSRSSFHLSSGRFFGFFACRVLFSLLVYIFTSSFHSAKWFNGWNTSVRAAAVLWCLCLSFSEVVCVCMSILQEFTMFSSTSPIYMSVSHARFQAYFHSVLCWFFASNIMWLVCVA